MTPIQKGLYFDAYTKSGGSIMGIMGKLGIVMGVMPVITQIMTNNFHINIIEFITGNELMSKLKKILSKVMKKTSSEKEKEKLEKEKTRKKNMSLFPTDEDVENKKKNYKVILNIKF